MKISNITKSFFTLFTLCILLLIIRINLTGEKTGFFLVWNMFLAFVPLLFILSARKIFKLTAFKTTFQKVIVLSFTALWLLFFPNAPYIITDLIHLKHLPAPFLWFDSLAIFVSALTALAIGFYSLSIFHSLMKSIVGPILAWLSLIVSLVLTGFGLYLGRVIRLNSWDVFTHPFSLMQTILFELSSKHALLYSAVFSFVLMGLYLSFHFINTQDETP